MQNWVDIEEEYYKALKQCFEKNKGIEELNNEFKNIQTILEEYLTKQVNINGQKAEIIYQKIYYPQILGGNWSEPYAVQQCHQPVYAYMLVYTCAVLTHSMPQKNSFIGCIVYPS